MSRLGDLRAYTFCEKEMKDARSFSQKVEAAIPDEILIRTFAKLDALALGLAVGIVAGISLFTATAILSSKAAVLLGRTSHCSGITCHTFRQRGRAA